MHILYADNDEDERLFFADAFAALSKNIDLKFVSNGNELIKYLNDPNNILPTIIFLDLKMPSKDGIECLTEIRQSEEFKHLTVAIYSTSNNSEDIHKCFVLGANVYITKPNDFEMLKKVLHKVLSVNWQYHMSDLSIETFFLTL